MKVDSREKGAAGVFYGVGVGPGDPELMTIKSLRVLRDVPVIAVPRSEDTSSDGQSQALLVVKKAIGLDDKEVIELLFPMTKDKEALKAAREKAATIVAQRLRAGSDVAFITLGDPMLYSTFSYLAPLVGEMLPEARISIVPGVTSFSAAAGLTLEPLAESGEKVVIIPAAYDIKEVREALKAYDTVVLMKVNRHFDSLVTLLSEMGLERKSVFISRVGWPDEEFTRDISSLKGRKLDYFSMVIVKKGL